MKVLDINGGEILTMNRLRSRNAADPSAEEAEALRQIRTSLGVYSSPVSRSVDGYPQMMIGVPI